MKLKTVISLAMSVLALCSCRRVKEPDEPKPASYLTVDHQSEDHEVKLYQEGASSSFIVNCDAEWEMTPPEDAAWFTIGEKKSTGKHTWSIPYTAAPNDTPYPRSTVVKFVSGEFVCNCMVTQAAPDPLTLNKVPGLYGLELASITVSGQRQSSSIHYGSAWAYRIIDPVTLTIYVLGDIPENIYAGNKITLRYKKIVQGMVETLETIPDVEVVRSLQDQGMVWLRQNESVYFIVEK